MIFLLIITKQSTHKDRNRKHNTRVTSGMINNTIWLDVRDTGIGIPENSLPHIFNTFWRQDQVHSTPGFGLGLSIAKKAIELHDGQITVESEVGQGTCIRIMLPTLKN